jgi:glycosyltransferase involved in cell wall biosynthesis
MHAYLPHMLHSICGQSYTNWKLIITDDVSNEDSYIQLQEIVEKFQTLHPNKIEVIYNDQDKKWETANVLNMIDMCQDDDIICRIDCDDWLTDLDALAIIDSAYQGVGCDALWTSHRWSFSDKNISGPMPDNADPYKYPWVSSHLKTFRKNLLNGVSDTNFRGQDGEYVRRAGDQALYLPVLHHAKKRLFLNRCLYHYTIKDEPATYQTQDALFQRDEALFLRERGYVDK